MQHDIISNDVIHLTIAHSCEKVKENVKRISRFAKILFHFQSVASVSILTKSTESEWSEIYLKIKTSEAFETSGIGVFVDSAWNQNHPQNLGFVKWTEKDKIDMIRMYICNWSLGYEHNNM